MPQFLNLVRQHICRQLRFYTQPRIALLSLTIPAIVAALNWFDAAPLYLAPMVRGASMSPIMKPGDHLLVCRWCRPQKGELVLVDNRSPLRERTAAVHRSLASRVNDAQVTFYIKRVAATEGQTPPPYSEKLWNEYRLPVPLSKIRAQLAPTPQKIPAGYVWLLGSNVNSIDSRFWGAVPLNLCKGTVLLVIPTHLSVL